ncbi:MAG TPA: hypothetical protein PK926_05465 [Spirochaetota bacterium]|nr:hypothetical protein [Spirochaetota bacterium]HPI89265.1 hypothetical protein [Spirochaetota bacterium]HPR48575.1 hypothetical protein [Spirochaetota bacterium]
MNTFIDTIASNPIYATLAVLAGIMLLWAIMKRLVKAAFFLFVVLTLYAGYLSYTGRSMPQNREDIIREGASHLQTLKDISHSLLMNFTDSTVRDALSKDSGNADESINTHHQNIQ